TIVVTPYHVTYDGNTHTATGTATGVKGEALSGLDLTGTTHTNFGIYTDTWRFTEVTGSYKNAGGGVSDQIVNTNEAIVLTPYHLASVVSTMTAAGSATGVKCEELTGLDLIGTTHTVAGDYPADPWTFTDVTGNYNNASGTVHDHIDKANATIVVTPYTVT